MTEFLLDSWAWIEFLEGTPKGITVMKHVEKASRVLTTAANLYEVLYRTHQDRGGERMKQVLSFIENKSEILPIDRETAIAAVDIRLREKLHAIDALTLAASRLNNVILLTGDQHFRNLRGVLFIE